MFVPVTEAQGQVGWRGSWGGEEGLTDPVLNRQEGTSRFATLEMNPKRAQKRPKETVSVCEAWERQGAGLPVRRGGGRPQPLPPAAAVPDLLARTDQLLY